MKMLKQKLIAQYIAIIKKLPKIHRLNMLLFYVKLFMLSLFIWNLTNSNNSTLSDPWNKHHSVQYLQNGKNKRQLAEYHVISNQRPSGIYSLEDMDDDERQDKLQELLKYYNVFLNLYPVLNSKDKLIELKVADRPQEEVNIVTEKGNVLQVNLSEDREADNDVNISIEVSEIIVHAEDIEEVEDIINSDIFGDTDNFDISDDFEEFNDIDNFICLDINDNNYTVFPNFFFEKIKMYKRKYLNFFNKYFSSFTKLKNTCGLLYEHVLLFLPIGLMLVAFLEHLRSPNSLISTGALSLALFTSLAF
ncbi:Plasmodium exported protein, unknown function [Plasmodium ovale]|uniref:Uncharacterized protein n=1 Tax=Plasmodium ovale TaxID=36330 RepID=A0A1C3KN07_PLAOA|nr:Plasmodium exported protein, unknown function [Plasmodium ovale]